MKEKNRMVRLSTPSFLRNSDPLVLADLPESHDKENAQQVAEVDN